MSVGHKDKNGKFHPHTPYSGVSKSRDQSAKTQGVRLKRTTPKQIKVTPSEKLREEVREAVPENMVEGEVKRIQAEEQIEQMIPERFRRYIDLDDALEVQQMSRSKIKKITEEKINGLTVFNFEFENGEEIFFFKSLSDEHKFVENNIKERFERGDYDDKKFSIEDYGSRDSPPDSEDYDLIDFTKMGDRNKIKKFVTNWKHDFDPVKIEDEISFFMKSPFTYLEKRNVQTKEAIREGALLRDIEKFLAFKRKEGHGELVDFDHPKYELLKTLPSYKHSFKEK